MKLAPGRFAAALTALAKARGDIKPQRTGPGPVRWCKHCSRYHGSRVACDLYLQEKIVHGPGQQIRVLRYWRHRYEH